MDTPKRLTPRDGNVLQTALLTPRLHPVRSRVGAVSVEPRWPRNLTHGSGLKILPSRDRAGVWLFFLNDLPRLAEALTPDRQSPSREGNQIPFIPHSLSRLIPGHSEPRRAVSSAYTLYMTMEETSMRKD